MIKQKSIAFIKTNLGMIIIVSALIVLLLVGGLVNASFLTFNHIVDIMYLNTMFGILAIAQTIVILAGGIDMSVGAVYWVTIMLGSQYMNGDKLFTGILYVLAIGIAVGIINGVCIAKLKIPYVVTTMAMMIILTGVLYVVTGGGGHGKAPEALHAFSIARLPAIGGSRGLPIRVLLWLALTVVMAFALNKTTFGWTVRALGSNPAATRYCGLRGDFSLILVYVISSVFAVIAGLLYMGQAGTPYPSFEGGVGVGTGITMETIAAVIVGGTFFTGGKGGFINTFLGILILSTLYSLLSMAGMGENTRSILNGVIILAVVALYSRNKD